MRTTTRTEYWDEAVQPNGSVFGGCGMSYEHLDDGSWLENEQDNCLIIEQDVHIGPNCTIHRGGWRPTHIRAGCRMGAQVNVGHQVSLGENCLVAPLVSIAGSCTIGKGVVIWQGALIHQKISIGDGAVIGMGAVVMKNVPPGAVAYGNPAKIRKTKENREEAWPPGC